MMKSKKVSKKHRDRLIKEIQGRQTNLNKGGSRGKKLMTAYREDCIKILWLASRQEYIAPKDGVRLGIAKSPSILRDNYYGWFQRIARGRYAITETGEGALNEYAELLESLTEELKDKIAQRQAEAETSEEAKKEDV